MQAAVGIIIFAIAYKYLQSIKDQVSLWIKDLNLIYVNGFLEIFGASTFDNINYNLDGSCVWEKTAPTIEKNFCSSLTK